jgi:nitroreductase
LDRCFEAARLAPSACNSQPWSFLVVDQPQLKNRLADAALGGLYSMCAFAKGAPVLVVLITESSKKVARMGGFWRGVPYNLIDIGIAGEHFALQAAEEGLGTCWLGWFDEKAVKKVLVLPRSTRIDVLFSVGWPATPEVREKVRKPLAVIRRYGP